MHLYFMIYFTIFSILPQKILKNKEESYFFINQLIARRLVTLLAILFLCAPIGLLNADSTTEPQTTLHKTITPISGQDDKYELPLDITSKLGTETQTDPLDVVLVADLSGSMSKRDVPSSTGRTITGLDALKKCP